MMPGFSKSQAVKALHDAGISVERLTHVVGCSQHEMSTALQATHRAVPHLHKVIAALVGMPLSDLWPRFYDESSSLRPGVLSLDRARHPASWRARIVPHDEIVRRMPSRPGRRAPSSGISAPFRPIAPACCPASSGIFGHAHAVRGLLLHPGHRSVSPGGRGRTARLRRR